jgi:excisionase family DNA binding protein
MALRDQERLPFSNGRESALGVARASATLTIPEAAKLLGVGRNLAYEIARRDGELAGVPVIRVGRRLLIPYARLLSVLGLSEGPDSVGR